MYEEFIGDMRALRPFQAIPGVRGVTGLYEDGKYRNNLPDEWQAHYAADADNPEVKIAYTVVVHETPVSWVVRLADDYKTPAPVFVAVVVPRVPFALTLRETCRRVILPEVARVQLPSERGCSVQAVQAALPLCIDGSLTPREKSDLEKMLKRADRSGDHRELIDTVGDWFDGYFDIEDLEKIDWAAICDWFL